MHLFFAVLLALTQQWLMVSDLHVEPFDAGSEPSYYWSDSNWALLDLTIAQMRQAEPNPAVVVISGDFLAHHFDTKARASKTHASTMQVATDVMTRIESKFAHAFPKAQFLIALGNNDDPCGDYSSAINSPYLKRVAKMWEPLVNRHGAAPDFLRQFSHAGYYTAQLPGGARAVVLDSVFWSVVFHTCGGSPNPAAEQLGWLSTTLSQPGKPAIVLMHIPPGVDAKSTLLTHRFIVVPFLQTIAERRVEQIIAANRARLRFILAGHAHMHDVRALDGVPLVIAPAISPIYGSNPSFLRMQVDGGVLRDLQLYAYDLNSGGWSQAYDFDRIFGVNALTGPEIASVHERLGRDADLRAQWASWMVGDSSNTGADRWNWRAYWCAQSATGSAYVACAGDQKRVAFFPAALLAGVLLVAGVVIVLLRLASQRRRA